MLSGWIPLLPGLIKDLAWDNFLEQSRAKIHGSAYLHEFSTATAGAGS